VLHGFFGKISAVGNCRMFVTPIAIAAAKQLRFGNLLTSDSQYKRELIDALACHHAAWQRVRFELTPAPASGIARGAILPRRMDAKPRD
jgi:hypothetical protein